MWLWCDYPVLTRDNLVLTVKVGQDKLLNGLLWMFKLMISGLRPEKWSVPVDGFNDRFTKVEVL